MNKEQESNSSASASICLVTMGSKMTQQDGWWCQCHAQIRRHNSKLNIITIIMTPGLSAQMKWLNRKWEAHVMWAAVHVHPLSWLSHTHWKVSWPVEHAGFVCHRFLFAQSEHPQVPASLQLSDKCHFMPLLHHLFAGEGIALSILGVAAVGLWPAEWDHRLSSVNVRRLISTAVTSKASSAAPSG